MQFHPPSNFPMQVCSICSACVLATVPSGILLHAMYFKFAYLSLVDMKSNAALAVVAILRPLECASNDMICLFEEYSLFAP